MFLILLPKPEESSAFASVCVVKVYEVCPPMGPQRYQIRRQAEVVVVSLTYTLHCLSIPKPQFGGRAVEEVYLDGMEMVGG